MAIVVAWVMLPAVADAQDRRPWDLSLRAFVEFDDNVPLVADDTPGADEEGLGGGVSASGVYRFVQEDPWEAGVTAELLQTIYLDSDVNDFNLSSIAPGIYVSRDINLMDRPGTASVAYNGYADWLDGDEFLQSHGPNFQVTVLPTTNTELSAHYRISFDDFDEEGGDPPVTSRDATQHGIGFGGTYYMNAGRQSVSLNYEYINNDADGDNFVYTGHQLSGEFFTELGGPFALALQAGFGTQEYDDFVTPPDREMDNTFLRAIFYMALSPNLSLDVNVGHSIYDSNRPEFEAERTSGGAGVTWRL